MIDVTWVHRWTEDERTHLQEFAPGHSCAEIREEWRERYGVDLSRSQVKNAQSRFHARSCTVGGRFENGRVPGNKGLKWDDFMPPESQARCRATCFRPGNMPSNGHQPLGTERVEPDGYVLVKTAMRKTDPRSAHDNWAYKHRMVWEQANGRKVPDGSMVVFADGDKSNFDPDNLVCMTRAVHAVICHQHIWYHDRDSCESAILVARLKHRINEVACRQRACKSCGKTFEPEHPRQVRCLECIDRMPKDDWK